MKNFKMLSRAEMKKIAGGLVVCPPGYTPCSDTGCSPFDDTGSCIDGIGEIIDEGPDPSVAACLNKAEGANCSYKSAGIIRNGNCVMGTWTSLYCNVPG